MLLLFLPALVRLAVTLSRLFLIFLSASFTSSFYFFFFASFKFYFSVKFDSSCLSGMYFFSAIFFFILPDLVVVSTIVLLPVFILSKSDVGTTSTVVYFMGVTSTSPSYSLGPISTVGNISICLPSCYNLVS